MPLTAKAVEMLVEKSINAVKTLAEKEKVTPLCAEQVVLLRILQRLNCCNQLPW